jgi:hypothetical protein
MERAREWHQCGNDHGINDVLPVWPFVAFTLSRLLRNISILVKADVVADSLDFGAPALLSRLGVQWLARRGPRP